MHPSNFDLFADHETEQQPRAEQIGEQSWLLRGFALPLIEQLLPALKSILLAAPLRHMMTPGGFSMSVGTSSCGALGWITDRTGYRYSSVDPLSGLPWPALPPVFAELAHSAAARAGFAGFDADSCLINRYVPGGVPAMCLFGGFNRSDKSQRIALLHGDMVIWGGVDRLRFHGVLPIKQGRHPRLGEQRINLTFRVAG
jgi:alkylated DNA repair protein (DNA oxidative demethylase)